MPWAALSICGSTTTVVVLPTFSKLKHTTRSGALTAAYQVGQWEAKRDRNGCPGSGCPGVERVPCTGASSEASKRHTQRGKARKPSVGTACPQIFLHPDHPSHSNRAVPRELLHGPMSSRVN